MKVQHLPCRLRGSWIMIFLTVCCLLITTVLFIVHSGSTADVAGLDHRPYPGIEPNEIHIESCSAVQFYDLMQLRDADTFPICDYETHQTTQTLLRDTSHADDTVISDDIPVILWWTDFTHDPGSVKQCGDVSCFFTNNRKFKDDPRTKVFMFYGSSLELHDLPLPRKPEHEWALLHEESPKNNWAFSNERMMELINHTATFKRESDYPLTLQWLTSIADIESKEFFHSVEEKNSFLDELAPIAYVQSDCGAPSDRDTLVTMLSKHIKVDSMGKCLHNKDLPKHISENLSGMNHKDFYKLLSKYKFVIAAENAVCDDYITEKLWRSFYVGTVPIVYGSPRIKELLPCEDCALPVASFRTVKQLVEYVMMLNTNDTAYDYLRRYKFAGVSNKLLINLDSQRDYSAHGGQIGFYFSFECYLCEAIHTQKQHSVKRKTASQDHYGCPEPRYFRAQDELLQDLVYDDWRSQEYHYRQYQIEAFRYFTDRGLNWTYMDLYTHASKRIEIDFPKQEWLVQFKRYALNNEF